MDPHARVRVGLRARIRQHESLSVLSNWCNTKPRLRRHMERRVFSVRSYRVEEAGPLPRAGLLALVPEGPRNWNGSGLQLDDWSASLTWQVKVAPRHRGSAQRATTNPCPEGDPVALTDIWDYDDGQLGRVHRRFDRQCTLSAELPKGVPPAPQALRPNRLCAPNCRCSPRSAIMACMMTPATRHRSQVRGAWVI